MTEFQKGDKFIPRKPKDTDPHFEHWIETMDLYDGKTQEVRKITINGWLQSRDSGYCFRPDWCEKVGDSEIPNDHIPEVGKTIDWEQRKYELAKEFMSPLLIGLKTSEIAFIPIAVSTAIVAADEMIKQLKAE